MRRGLEQQLQTQALPNLREKLAQEFESGRHQHHHVREKKGNPLIDMFIATKNWVQNAIAFLFTLVFLIPLWIFKIVLKCFDSVQRGVRFVLWLYVKVIVLLINFVYKLLQFFRITAAVNFFKKTVKKYLGNYSSDQEQGGETLSGLELIMNKTEHNLIDVKKVQKKIKTPNIFLNHQGSNRKIFVESEREEYIERINRELVPQRTVHENIVQTSHRLKSPQLLTLSQSHSRLKRTSTEPNLLSPSLQIQLPLNRQQTSPLKRMEPDRDISPERYNKNPLLFSQSGFKKKLTPQKQILMVHHHPIIHGTKTEKEVLEQQLLTLRTKMQDLINQNNHEIHELQNWIQQKSETILMTRKQNLQLLNKIQQLQKQNIRKNDKFTELQGKIKDMELMLEKEKNLRNGLNSEVQKLEEQIKIKTIQIMSLKDKIRKNFVHLQQMQNIFSNGRVQLQNQQQKQNLQVEEKQGIEPFAELQQSRQSLKKDLNEAQVFDISNPYLPVQTIQDDVKDSSIMKEVDQIPNPQDITEEVEPSHKTESEIQQSEKLIPEQDIQKQSIKSTPAEQVTVTIPFEEKIKQQQQSTAKLVEQVEEFLIQEQEKLQSIINEPLPLKNLIESEILSHEQIVLENKPQEKNQNQKIQIHQEKQIEEETEEKEQQSKEPQQEAATGTKQKKKNKKKKR